MKELHVGDHVLSRAGRIPRLAQLRDEYYDCVKDADAYVQLLKSQKGKVADIFTFLQGVNDVSPRYQYFLTYESAAVLELSTYEQWWKKQINDKTRNMVRKGGKAGVEIREETYSDSFIEGIVKIYNENPLRQGRRFRHYGKSFSRIKEEHSSFLDRSELFGAYYKDELIGFIKLVHGDGVSNLMQIVSMIGHRDKAPTNALLAKAVERCTARGVTLLHYGAWSRRSMGDFKKHHAFKRVEVPRYYVPLTMVGSLCLRMGLQKSLMERIPESWRDQLATWRGKWNQYRYAKISAKPTPKPAVTSQAF